MPRPHRPLEDCALLTTSEAARELGVAAKTVREWTSRGRLPCTRTPAGFRIYSGKELNKFVEARGA